MVAGYPKLGTVDDLVAYARRTIMRMDPRHTSQRRTRDTHMMYYQPALIIMHWPSRGGRWT